MMFLDKKFTFFGEFFLKITPRYRQQSFYDELLATKIIKKLQTSNTKFHFFFVYLHPENESLNEIH